jgi:hypothetical protein
LQRVGTQRGAADRLGRGEKLERRQHVAPARFARRARRRFRLARPRRLVVVLRIRLRLGARLQRDAGALVEARLGATGERGVASNGRPRAPRQQAHDAGLETEEAMGDPAERDRSPLLVVGDRILVIVIIIAAVVAFIIAPVGVPSEACGDRKACQRPDTRRDRDGGARQGRKRTAGEDGGQPQEPVADDAAEPDRQRPGRTPRQGGGAGRGQQHGQDPDPEANALALQWPMAGEPPSPNGDRQDQRERRHAEKLDQQVGDDGAGYAEHVAHRRIRGMAERRILHRPGHEREAEQRREHDQDETTELAQPPMQRLAHRVGEEAQADETAVDGRHDRPQPNTATRRCKACAVVSWSCTMATRI